MIKIKKILYIYKNGSRKIESTNTYMCRTKEQMESLRLRLIKNFNCIDVRFTYEEH